MADSVSIVLKLNEDLSSGMKDISSAAKGLSKEMEQVQEKAKALGTRYEHLNQRSAETQAQALSVKREMNEAAAAFKKTGEEADQIRFTKLKEEYQSLTDSAKAYSSAAKDTMKEMTQLQESARKQGNSEQHGMNLGSVGKALRTSEWLKQFSSSAAELGSVLLESTVGQPTAMLGSDLLSGAFSGASAGTLFGPWGILGGAAVGALSGAVSGGAKLFEAKDEAFKDYYRSLYETVSQATEEGLTNGKTLAAQRETTKVSFRTLLGNEEQADSFLGDVLTTANTTPFLYDDLVGLSKTLLTFGYAVEDIIPTLAKVGDAGAALGLSTTDIGTVSSYLGRMKSSDKASLEYLNPLNERGFSVFQWLADDLGLSQTEVYEKLSKNELSGSYVSELILKQFEALYSGQMAAQSQTTEGLDSTLQGLMENIEAAGGEGYHALRNEGKTEDIAAYSGALGEALSRMNQIAGETEAYTDNLREQYTREALGAVLLGQTTTVFTQQESVQLAALRAQFEQADAEYRATGEREAALEMENLRETAEALATGFFESSQWYQKTQDAELELIDAIRENTSTLASATDSYELQNTFSKGRGLSAFLGDPQATDTERSGNYHSYTYEINRSIAGNRDSSSLSGKRAEAEADTSAWRSSYHAHAFGLRRVPYDGYPALLHQGEQVLTAAEARGASDGGVKVTFSGPITVRQDSDLEEIAQRLADKIEQARNRAG